METITFITSLLTFYMKGEIGLEQNFVKFKRPNTILTFIPLGSKNDSIPVTHISSAGTNFKLLIKPFLIGLVLVFLGLAMFGDKEGFLLGLILLLIGAAMVLSAFQTLLVVRETSGRAIVISFLVFQKSRAEQAASQINMLISRREDDTNVRMQNVDMKRHSEDQTDRLINAINKN